ncbi:MAG: hypothetical protein JNK90_30065 [Planctomycetaceae bacterium]|nr:hypothetical protein [Planctomycetaceae bacterium]
MSISRWISVCVCVAMLPGCGNKPWLDKYGDLMCEKFEERETLLKSMTDQASLEANASKYFEWVEEYDQLESEMIKYSWTKNDSSLVIDKQKLAELSKRWEASQTSVVKEIERLRSFAKPGSVAKANEFLHRVNTKFRNPFAMQHKPF